MGSNEDPYPNPYRQKANPSQAYEITLTIEDAPGPFAVVNGYASYKITNQTCLPPRDNFAGVQRAPMGDNLQVEYRKIDETHYVATIYTDLMEVADYYGHGTCEWTFNSFYTVMRATGAAGETEFISVLSPDEVAGSATVITHLWRQSYPRAEITAYREFGVGEDKMVGLSPDRREKAFRTQLTARKIGP